MNKYQEMFHKYSLIANKGYSFDEIVEVIKKSLEPSPVDKEANAIILFGFSGNGKTTWIDKFVKENPSYVVISMDKIVNAYADEVKRPITSDEIIEIFGDALEEHLSNHDNVIIDGSFLNILTRSILTDTLRYYDYNINLVDISLSIKSRLNSRIIYKCSEDLGVRLTKDNINSYINNPIFIRRYNDILSYYQRELTSSEYQKQVKLGLLNLGVDNVYSEDVDYNELLLKNSMK